MTVSVGLLLFAVLIGVFGCGFFCGSLVFRNQQVVQLTLPGETLVATGPVNELQAQLRRIEEQLRQHGARLSHDVMALRAATTPDAQAKSVHSLIQSNDDFEKQVHGWVEDARSTRERWSRTLSPPILDARPHAGSGPAAAEAKPVERPSQDRRSEDRHPFFCKQWVAPYNGIRAPEPEEFFLVQCRDISSGGISFFLDRKPKFHLVVIRLQGPDRPKYLTARIQRTMPSDQRQYGRHTIGCQFLGTLHPDALAPNLDSSVRRREGQLLEAECLA